MFRGAQCERHILNSKLVHLVLYLIVSVYNAHIELHWKIGWHWPRLRWPVRCTQFQFQFSLHILMLAAGWTFTALSFSFNFNFFLPAYPGPWNRPARAACPEDQRRLGGPKSWRTNKLNSRRSWGDKINARRCARSFIYWTKHSRARIVYFG